MAEVLNTLGQTILPQIFSSLNRAGLTDLMEVVRRTPTAGTGGGHVKGTESTIYSEIPVTIESSVIRSAGLQGQRPTSHQSYVLEFPAFFEGEYLEVKTDDKLKVLERGDVPEKIYTVESIDRGVGITFKAYCKYEG